MLKFTIIFKCFINGIVVRINGDNMAASLKAAKKMKIDYNIDRKVYDEFIKTCTRSGYTPNVVTERLMKKYIETKQM